MITTMEGTDICQSSRLGPGEGSNPERVEFGCEHLQEMMSHSPMTSEKFKNSFSNLQEDVLRLPAIFNQTLKQPGSPMMENYTVICPTYLCTQCSSIFQIRESREHSQTKGHVFSVESRSGYLFCAFCDDFVYDAELERIRTQIQASCKGRKMRRLDVMPPPWEMRTVPNPPPCKIGVPRTVHNLGQSCYLSVILQAMAHNPLMRDYSLSNQHDPTTCANKNCVACALMQSLKELLITEEEGPYIPADLLCKSWQNSSTLAGYAQQDAHEYFQFIVNQLHESSGFYYPSKKKHCPCISHRTFSGQLRSTVTCLSCDTVTTSSDPIMDLSLDVRAASAQSEISFLQGSLDFTRTAAAIDGPAIELKLTNCLQNFAAPEKLPAEEGYICSSRACNRTPQPVTKHLTIKKLPATLCIHIKRYEHAGHAASAQKIPTRVTFPLQLDMSPYTTRILDHSSKQHKSLDLSTPDSSSVQAANQLPTKIRSIPDYQFLPRAPLSAHSPGWYDLSTIIVHKGTMQGGHYLIYCQRDGKWLRYDDEKLTAVGEASVLAQNPYLLFYQSRDDPGLDIE